MRVAITGATGLIGTRVSAALRARGDTVVALSRHAGAARDRLGGDVEVVQWADPLGTPAPPAALAGADGVIHLLGEPVAQRWTEQARTAIRDSRALGTRNLVRTLAQLSPEERPGVLVSQSATGYYGPRGDERLTESSPAGDDFLAGVVVAWEAEAHAAEPLLRVVCMRTGVVLAPAGGALEKMLPVFRLGIGGPVGSGRQYVPWIHVDDVVGGLLHALDDGSLHGPVNLTAPEPVTNRELSHALGRALHRPAFWPVPGAAVKLLYGGMAAIVLTGQRAVPAQLSASGFPFRYPDLDAALADVVAQL
jgi:uncharacterized protein (TIGR01777 family)